MAKKKPKKKKNPGTKKKSSSARKPESARHGTVTIPRGMMLVPVGGTARNPAKKKSGRRPQRRNPEPEAPHHTMLKNGAAAVGFGAVAAAVGMLGGYALSKANLKSKAANVAANVATGAIVGGGVGMLDRTAGTVVAHNYMVAATQWLSAPDAQTPAAPAKGAAPQMRAGAVGASPGMLNRAPATATHGLYDDEQPDPESITRARPAPLNGYRGVNGMGSPLDNLGSPLDQLGGYDHVEGIIADDIGAFEHLGGILADNLGDGDDVEGVIADDIGDDDGMGGDEDGLGFLRA